MFDEEFDMSKAENPAKSLAKLLHYVKKYLPGILVALACAGGAAVTSVIGPDYISDLTDTISAGLGGTVDMQSILHICRILVLIYGISVLLTYGQSWIMATVTQRISKNLRTDIDAKLSRLPFRYFDSTTFGNVISRVTNDVDTISMTLNESIINMLAGVVKLIGVLIMMLITNLTLSAIAVVSSVVGFAFVGLIMSRSQKYFYSRQEQLGTLNGYIEEQYSGAEVVKAFGREKGVIAEFKKMNTKLYQAVWKSEFYSGLMMPIMNFMGNFSYVAVCAAGGAMALSGKVTFGTIIAFTMYVRTFSEPLNSLTQIAMTLQSTAAASERVFDLLESEELSDESGVSPTLDKAAGAVEFSHLRFGYDPEKTVIHDFCASAKPGQKVAIVGPTGAGKTTLVNLLMRFYEPDSGTITIDGVDISATTRENVHDQFCMVLQDTWLFEGTIRENLAYSTPNVTDEMLWSAVKAVGIDHYIRTLPQGFDTQLSDRTSLSAGQKQQLTIARAIIKNAPILILDEATSSVDTRTELIIQNAMDLLMKGRTSFVIAHRLSTIKNADIILCVNNGDIVEQGTHEELLRKNGFYADLYNSQFEQAS